MKAAFDVETVTKRFYDRFKKEHDTFLGFIKGIQQAQDKDWYASLMLNRLMFIYFIQKKGFLDYLKREGPDVMCLQETKAAPDQLGAELLAVDGYDSHFVSAEKKGYTPDPACLGK